MIEAPALAKFVTIQRASEAFGYSVKAIEMKISRRDWLEGVHFTRAPDGRIFINVAGVEAWIAGAASGSGRLGG